MKTRLQKDSWLLTMPIAHRGYHNKEVAENSLDSAARAIERGYAIELDVQMSADDKLYVFHDDNVGRMTGKNADIRLIDGLMIESLKLFDGQKIPSFSEFLEFVGGKVPLLVEIKQQKRKGIERRVLDALKGYGGEYVIQSFDPFIMLEIKKLAPDIIRGQLGTAKSEGGALKKHVVANLSFNFLTKPDFINYDISCFPIKPSVSNGLPVLGWTVRNESDLEIAKKYCDNFVFENLSL